MLTSVRLEDATSRRFVVEVGDTFVEVVRRTLDACRLPALASQKERVVRREPILALDDGWCIGIIDDDDVAQTKIGRDVGEQRDDPLRGDQVHNLQRSLNGARLRRQRLTAGPALPKLPDRVWAKKQPCEGIAVRTEQADMVSIARPFSLRSICLGALRPEDLSRKVTLKRGRRPRPWAVAEREELRRKGAASLLENVHPDTVRPAVAPVNSRVARARSTRSRLCEAPGMHEPARIRADSHRCSGENELVARVPRDRTSVERDSEALKQRADQANRGLDVRTPTQCGAARR